MPIDNLNSNGPTSASKDDKKSANLYPHPVIARVKSTIDSTRTGAIWVYILGQGADDSDDKNSWKQVQYSTPYYGYTKPSASGTDHGGYVGNPHSYGFWASAPDVGTMVICIFINGSPNFGYYIGCVPEPEKLFMVPAIGASFSVTVNKGEGESYGGVDRLPVTNINSENQKIAESANFLNEAKPVHSYAAAILNKQGLLRDKHRGVIGSSAQRESPSRVIGISTPGRPIYEGGFTDQTILDAASRETDSSKLKVVGRRGGHSLVLDDGDLLGEDQLVRLRSATGHQIMMNDTSQSLTIIHANGQSWVELGAEGTVDVYSTNSVNVRSQGDLNLHADRDINMHAGKKFNVKAEEITMNCDKNMNFRSVLNTSFYAQGTFGVSVDSSMSFLSSGEASLKSESTTYINGSRVNLETGSSAFVPAKIKPIDLALHEDTVYDSGKGFIGVPGKLESITSRAPTHWPWKNAGKGVDVTVDLESESSAASPSQPSETVAMSNTPTATPDEKSSPEVLATVPLTGTSDPVKSAIVSQVAVTAAVGQAKDAVTKGAAIVTGITGASTVAVGQLGTTVSQLATAGAGVLKPGADKLVNAAVAQGKSAVEALSPALFTGNNGVKSLGDFVKSPVAQVGAITNLIDKSMSDLTKLNVLSGKEKLASIAGTVTASITAGVKNVASLIKDPVGSLSKIPGVGNVISAVKKAVNSGNFAASLVDSIRGALPDPAKIASAIPTLKFGVPLNLIKENAPKELAGNIGSKLTGALSGAASGIAGAVSGVTGAVGAVSGAAGKLAGAVSGVTGSLNSAVSGVTGAVGAVSGAAGKLAGAVSGVTGSLNSAVSGVTGAVGAVSGVTGAAGAVSGAAGKLAGAVSGVTGAVSGALTSAKSLMSKLEKGDLGDIDKTIGEVGLGLPGGLKLPQIAAATTKVASLAKQSASLLGNPKIPPLALGAGIDTKQLQKQLDTQNNLNIELAKASDESFEANKKYRDAKYKFGVDDDRTIEANAAWQEALKKENIARNNIL